MVEHPRMTEEPDGSQVVWDVTRVRKHRDWRFAGWLLLGATIAIVLYDVRRWAYVQSPLEYLVPLGTALIAIILINVAGKPQIVERPLLRVTAEDPAGGAAVERCAPSGVESYDPGALTHVVYGLIDVPWPGREGVNVEAFAVYLAMDDGTPIPVIDGTMDKTASWQIASALSQRLGIPVIEMGKGMT